MSGVDDVFDAGGPPIGVQDRVVRVGALLALAAPLNLCSIACFTGVPGAVLTLVAWHLADEDLARVETGALPPERRDRIVALRRIAFVQMGVCSVLLLVQVALFMLGAYGALLQGALVLLGWADPAPA